MFPALPSLLALYFAVTPAPQRYALPAAPGDWPGWRGPSRDNLSRETGLLASWPKGGPTLLWKAKDLGVGYSTPALVGGIIYLLGTEDKDQECLIALSGKDGTRLWSTNLGKTTSAGGYHGPRSTPTVDGGMLYLMTSSGVLVAADAKSGEPRWKKDTKSEFGGRSGGWAYTESPLIDGDRVLCTPGADKATMVAFDKRTGELVWKADLSQLNMEGGKKKRSYTTAAYSSIVVAELAGQKQYVQFLSGGVVGVDAVSGQLLWNYDHPANKTANISTPVVANDAVFAASAYNTGGGLARIVRKDGKLEAEEAYFLDQMQNHHGGMVLLNGYLYGTNGNSLLCINLESGKVAWQNKSVGKGSVVYADGHLYVRSERGPIALVEANPSSYVETGRFDQPERSKLSAWPHPVIAAGCLYIRDQDLLFCYDVKGK